jgi:ribA/ribD-fused uncharacterized protein
LKNFVEEELVIEPVLSLREFPDPAEPYAPKTVTVDAVEYPTAEHWYQVKKFHGMRGSDLMTLMTRAREAFSLPRHRLFQDRIRKDWMDIRINVMRTALRAKFTQHRQLRKLLLETGNRPLVEHTDLDSFWGDGGDGHGKNMLGQLLMELRAELRCEVMDKEESNGDPTPQTHYPNEPTTIIGFVKAVSQQIVDGICNDVSYILGEETPEIE